MANMGYCRFKNTLSDLRDCFENWDVESESEQKAQKRMVKLCREIVKAYGDDDDSNALNAIEARGRAHA